MADENITIKPQTENGELQDVTPKENEVDAVPESETPPKDSEDDQKEDIHETENQKEGERPEEGKDVNGGSKQDGNNETNDNNSYNDDPGEEPSKNEGIDLSKLIPEVEKYKKGIEEKRKKSIWCKRILIFLCLVGLVFITRAFICDCENVTENVYAVIVLYCLLILLIIGATLLSYLLVSYKRRYDLAINRLELLITRLKLKNEGKNKSTIISDIDRELQLIARILETQTFF